MDRSTVVGVGLGLLFIGGAVLIGPASHAFWSLQSIVIVVGGVAAATLIRFPASVVAGTLRIMRQAFLHPAHLPTDLARDVVRLSYVVRRENLLAMERERIDDAFLRRGIELCVDGVEPATVESVLRTEGAAILERHERGQRMLRGMGASAPAFGMIGTLIGLVQMLTLMDDPSKIGSSMAVAILTTFYGALLAYLVFLPLADKLSERARQEAINREVAIQGLLGILAGYHPRLVERRLLSLLEPRAGSLSRGLRRVA